MYLDNLSTIRLFLLLPQHNTMGENSRKILSPSKANALIEVVKSHSPQCVSVCIISSVSRLVTVVMSDPGPRLPSRMRLSGSEHAVVYRHGRDKDLFSALIFNTIFVAVSTACLLIGAAMVVNANLGTKWLHCV